MSGISQLSFVLLTALLVCGCDSGDFPMFRGNLTRTGVYKTKGVEELTNLKWQFKTGDYIGSSPAISDGVVYFGSHDNNLYAVDAKTGQDKWKFKTAGGVNSRPAISDGVVYFGSGDKNLYALE